MTGMHLDGARWLPPLPGSTPALVSSFDITAPLPTVEAEGRRWGYFLVRANGTPVGWINCPVVNGRCTGRELRRAIMQTLALDVISQLLSDRLSAPLAPGSLTSASLMAPQVPPQHSQPKITVAVCTRDRPQDLERCLDSLRRLDYPGLEVLVVDNAPSSPSTRDLVRSRFPEFRYICERRPGLNWARNRALEETCTDLLAFTDDDIVVDRDWLSRLAATFEDDDVAAATGLIGPFELETDAQLHFEAVGGFGRGFRKAWHRIDPSRRSPDVYHLGAGRFGAGANMAFRTVALRELGGFDPALDVGTATEGGGDLDIFLRLLHQGHTLVYEPAAVVWHVHRRTSASLQAQIATWGTAVGAVLTAAFARYPGFRLRILRFGMVWSWLGYIGPLLRYGLGPGRIPRRLRAAPLLRLPKGPFRYIRARRAARSLGAESIRPVGDAHRRGREKVAVRTVDLAVPIEPLTDLSDHQACILHVRMGEKAVGTVRIENRGHPISTQEIVARVAQDLTENVLHVSLASHELARNTALADLLLAHLTCVDDVAGDEFSPRLASIVIASRDRPEQLRRCLDSLMAQATTFPFELIIVDNAPESGRTKPVVDGYPQATYVAEPVSGLSAARNSGFRAARGDILVATDDDVVAPPGWLQEIVQPFRFAHISVATGLVAPLSLEHAPQRHFEALGGLGKGGRSFEVGLDWLGGRMFQPPRAWDLGATANAAFRRTMLEDPRVGLLPESLGPGSPAGGGEDAYLFYRAVRMGYGVYYEAQAVLHHEHRSDPRALRRQMVEYGRGHVGYLLTTLVQDRDLRALIRLLTVLPAWHLWRLLFPCQRLDYPRALVLAELQGYVTGGWGWLRGRWRTARLGRAGRPPSCASLPVPRVAIDTTDA